MFSRGSKGGLSLQGHNLCRAERCYFKFTFLLRHFRPDLTNLIKTQFCLEGEMLPMYSFIHSYDIFEHLLYAKYSAGLDRIHASIAFTFIFLCKLRCLNVPFQREH